MKKTETPEYTILSPDSKKSTKGVDEIDDFFQNLKKISLNLKTAT